MYRGEEGEQTITDCRYCQHLAAELVYHRLICEGETFGPEDRLGSHGGTTNAT
jgi:hypothetical protein